MPRYRTTLRPAHGGGLPYGVTYRYVELPPNGSVSIPGLPSSRHRYGVVETDRELTPAELDHFDILEVSP